MRTLLARCSLIASLALLALPACAGAALPVTGRGLDHAFHGGSVQLPFRGPGPDQNSASCVATPSGGTFVYSSSGKYVYDDTQSYPYMKVKQNYLYSYDRRGQLIKRFAQGGIALLGSDPIDRPIQIESDSRGRVLVLSVARARKSKHTLYVLRRLTKRGLTDHSFAHGGVKRTVASVDPEIGFTQLPSGQLVVQEYRRIKSKVSTTIRVFGHDGTPDETFGDHGSVRVAQQVDKVQSLPGGELALAGTVYEEVDEAMPVRISVLTRSGMPATAWGDKGTIRIWQPPAGVQKQIEHNVSPVDGGAWTKYVYAVGIARARHHGLTVALAATHDEGASRWFATFRRGEPGIIESASHYLSDASAADGLTDAEYDEHWDLPDPRGGWIDVGYEYTGNSGLWTTRVSSAGKTVRTSGRDYNFLGDTEVATVSLVPGTRQIVGCGLLRAEVRKKVDTRAFAFKLRLK